MHYHDGAIVKVGDIVTIPMPSGKVRAQIVMLGDSGEHAVMDDGLSDWVDGDLPLGVSQVVVKWIVQNPLAHNDPRYAPVGDYMVTDLDCCITRVDDEPQ